MTPGTIHPWTSPGQSTGVGSHSLLQEIFTTQGSNSGLSHDRQILYQLNHPGNPLSDFFSICEFICGRLPFALLMDNHKLVNTGAILANNTIKSLLPTTYVKISLWNNSLLMNTYHLNFLNGQEPHFNESILGAVIINFSNCFWELFTFISKQKAWVSISICPPIMLTHWPFKCTAFTKEFNILLSNHFLFVSFLYFVKTFFILLVDQAR